MAVFQNVQFLSAVAAEVNEDGARGVAGHARNIVYFAPQFRRQADLLAAFFLYFLKHGTVAVFFQNAKNRSLIRRQHDRLKGRRRMDSMHRRIRGDGMGASPFLRNVDAAPRQSAPVVETDCFLTSRKSDSDLFGFRHEFSADAAFRRFETAPAGFHFQMDAGPCRRPRAYGKGVLRLFKHIVVIFGESSIVVAENRLVKRISFYGPRRLVPQQQMRRRAGRLVGSRKALDGFQIEHQRKAFWLQGQNTVKGMRKRQFICRAQKGEARTIWLRSVFEPDARMAFRA